jgi:hypothetical protein
MHNIIYACFMLLHIHNLKPPKIQYHNPNPRMRGRTHLLIIDHKIDTSIARNSYKNINKFHASINNTYNPIIHKNKGEKKTRIRTPHYP